MARFLKSKEHKRGLPPGTLLPVSVKKSDSFKVSVLSYNTNFFNEHSSATASDGLSEAKDKDTVTWIDIEGLNDTKSIDQIGKEFGLHKLWLEDILNTDHRPKVSELNEILFMIIKSVKEYSPKNGIKFEQISLFLGENFVLSFQEHPGDQFKLLKNRIQEGRGRVRSTKADYLYYAIVDFILDNYFSVLEKVGSEIEELEVKISKKLSSETPNQIMKYKTELLYLSKSAIPIRDSISHICRSNSNDVLPDTKIYFQDALEHSIQVVDVIEHYRQLLNSLMDFYQSKMNFKMNEIMKVLTIFASIFIPLTFIVGVYGMNFENMPELKWEYGYYYSLLFMGGVSIAMMIYFRSKKWF